MFIVAFVFARLGKGMLKLSRQTLIMGLIGGLVSGTAYGLVIYVKSTAPLGLVSTFRETSVVFAALIGMLLLGERPWKLRLRSEEHTSELQSRRNLVCRLLLEKKNKTTQHLVY